MLLIVSLFLICAVITPPVGEVVRRHQLAIRRRKQIEAFLRSTPVADYRFDGRPSGVAPHSTAPRSGAASRVREPARRSASKPGV
ncbi:MAG: hypothetical protein J7521_20750 [Caulobacter sp.]|nr:hypothetical protein [Caulobacter sp.]